MKKQRIAVIGVGNMGSKYASILQSKTLEGAELAALTRVKEPYRELLRPSLEGGIPVFDSEGRLFDAVETGSLKLDGVIIATPHYSHEEIALRAFKNGLNVLCDKPAGVYSRQGRNMDEAAKKAGLVYSMVFNQRTEPVYRKLKEIVASGKYGNLKRVNWVITDWYRPEKYYSTSSWHATWDKDGGGVLLNQAPHNLDLLIWICGMPKHVQGFCHEGRFHHIEVEDDVTAYLEWDNGASGTFITSTGDAPGINRLEISLDEALIVCENNTLKIGELKGEIGMKEAEYRADSEDYFKKLKGIWTSESFEKEKNAYDRIVEAFVKECNGLGTSIASGREGRLSLMLSNAVYLSSWEKRMVEVPAPDSAEERDFEAAFEKRLCDKRK